MKKQLEFAQTKQPGLSFGGSLLKNSHAKTKRPLSSKLPIHVVLRSTRNALKLKQTERYTNDLVRKTAQKYGIKIYSYANVGNHLHILLKLPDIRSWSRFIRELTGTLAQKLKLGWTQRPFTRIVNGWKKAFQAAKKYIFMNELEGVGLISRKNPRILYDPVVF